jgi:hypothetical protein
MWGVFFLSAWHTLKGIYQFRQADFVTAFQPTANIHLLAGLSSLWAILFLGLALALWQKRPFGQQAAPLLFISFTVYTAVTNFLYNQSPRLGTAELVVITSGIVCTLFIYWTLNRPPAQTYFGKEEEAERQHV